MSSAPSNVKQEPTDGDTPMEEVPESSQTPAETTDGQTSTITEQSDGSQVDVDGNKQPDEKGEDQNDQSDNEQSAKSGSHKPSPGNDDRSAPDDSSPTFANRFSPFSNPFSLKRGLKADQTQDQDGQGNRSRDFSPAVEDPEAKRAKTSKTFDFVPNKSAIPGFLQPKPFAGTAAPQAQPTVTSSGPHVNGLSSSHARTGIQDASLKCDLVGSNPPPDHMKTVGLVQAGRKPLYVNEYSINGSSILRIERVKDALFNVADATLLRDPDYRSKYVKRTWGDVADVTGVAATGNENGYVSFLTKLDPENEDRFQWRQTILIRIRWTDGEISYMSRGWWRDNYVAADPSAKDDYKNRKEDGYYYHYKVKGRRRPRENSHAFEDYRLFKYVFDLESQYFKAAHPGEEFKIDGRAKSPSPIDDNIRRFREQTIPVDDDFTRSQVHRSIEESPASWSDGESDRQSHNASRAQHRSSRRPTTSHTASRLVEPNGSPRPRSSNMFNMNRRPRRPFGATPRHAVAAY